MCVRQAYDKNGIVFLSIENTALSKVGTSFWTTLYFSPTYDPGVNRNIILVQFL